MSDEMQNQNNFGSTLKGALVFPAVINGVGAVNTARRARVMGESFGEAIALKEFKNLNTTLKNGVHKDVFSRGVALSNNYEKYKSAHKETAKLTKQAKKGKLSLGNTISNQKTKIVNFFKSEQKGLKTIDEVKDASTKAAKELKSTKTTLKAGQEVVEATAETGLKNTAKSLFKKEMTSKFNLAISALTTFGPALKEKVIPAFKEEGFGAGLKELAKAAARTACDFVGYGIGGALGRTLGTAIGTIICPGAGSFVGGAVGDAVGSILVGGKICSTVDKVIGGQEADSNSQTEQTQEFNQQAQLNQTENGMGVQNVSKLDNLYA